MSYLPQFPFAHRYKCLCLLLALIAVSVSLAAQTTTPQEPPPNSSTQKPAEPAKPQPENSSSSAELSSRDTAPTFKVRVNLVLVRVVVRDKQGKVVPNLHKEDFQLYDNRKLQTVSTFSLETPASRSVPTTTSSDPNAAPDPTAAAATAASLPQRFVSVLFDDQHMVMNDTLFVRNAATKFFDSLAPSDRVGIYTTSGQLTQEFTDNHETLRKSLLNILPRSPTQGIHDCPDIGYYQADEIVNKRDSQALEVAAEDAVQCAFNGDETQKNVARAMAQATAGAVLGREDSTTEFVLRHIEDAMRRLTAMPGQRVLVFVSPGFITSTLQLEFSDVVDRATKSNIVVNTIDARGLYTPDLGDIADSYRDPVQVAGPKDLYRVAAQLAQEDVLAQFADGTGGTYFHNRNDVDEGLREAGAAPEMTYLLGFSPQNLKLDGSMHTLKVSLTRKTDFKIQARHAYFAPRHVVDPVEAAKQEIQEALFSQDEIRDLPVDLHTQFFKTDAFAAKLAVLTHVDIKAVRFRKADGRNQDDLTVATAIFDENGNYVTGGEKIVEMKLLDTTYDRLTRVGLNLKSSFDVKPGTYLVRQVVRDSEGAQLAARNGAVVIPN